METEKEMFGHIFVQKKAPQYTYEFWVNSDGNRVIVTPPNEQTPTWRVWIPHLDQITPFEGEEADERAFSEAVRYIYQKTLGSK